MAREFADLHPELRSVARDLLATGEPDWALVTQAGWPGLEIPESLGGSGVSFAETAVVTEEIGRAAAYSPYLGVTLGVGALLGLPADDARDALLAGTVDGSGVPVAVLPTGEDPDITFTLGHDELLSGRAEFVPDAATATRLLVVARDADGAAVLAETAPESLVVTPQPVLDETHRLATVTADGNRPDRVWRFPSDAALHAVLDRAAVAVAADSLGVAEAMLQGTVDYVGMRRQFDRPIGSFQAVKHACADMLVQIRVTRQLVDAAVDAVAGGGDAGVDAQMAKAYATDTAVAVAGKAMQLHGGIGYTWESGIHVHLKRATLNRALFGSPARHRKALATRYG
ncbi:acyl-CoA dehydrogenase family protein [Mycobacterium sp. C31M]